MNIHTKSPRQRRINKVRAKVRGSARRPRLTVFRSHSHIYAQIIDDQQGRTLVWANDSQLPATGRMDKASSVGKSLAEKAKKSKITEIKFDRGPYNYHGRVKALAEAARQAGLKF